MIRSVLINLSFLVTCLCSGALIFRQRPKRHCIFRQYPHFCACLFGAFTGISGALLSYFTISADAGGSFDFHCLFLILAGLSGNVLSVCVCAMVQLLYHIASSAPGPVLEAETGSILLTLLLSFLTGQTSLSFSRKWLLCTALCIPVSLLEFISVTHPLQLWLTFTVCLMPASALAYWLLSTRRKVNALLTKFRRESTRDYLTGLNNVRRFDEMFNAAVRIAEKRGENLSLLMCDIDFFKKINDRYGHRSGDAILTQFSRILQHDFPLSVISRNGGEEFTVLLRGFSEAEALASAERLRADVEQFPFLLTDGSQVHITISIGASSCSGSGGELLLERADTALYTAKRSGRNKVSAAYSGRRFPTVRQSPEGDVSAPAEAGKAMRL